jgi:crotonobetainyl-CoA:carnitine CoA-transferase CaiB-like acyl-CoA transferase
VARLVAEGARAIKVEPPWGDPLNTLCKQWYDDLHRGILVERIDLKSPDGRARMTALLQGADVFLASQRPAALARLGLDARSLLPAFPSLRHVNIVGDTANAEEPGHDLTYQARAGMLGRALPPTLFADMAGAERARAVINEVMSHPGTCREIGLFDALTDLAAPLRYGLTARGGHLGGGNPAYGIYAALDGRIAVTALEPHFRARLYEGLGLADGADPSAIFATRTAIEWEQWAAARDLPLVAIRAS